MKKIKNIDYAFYCCDGYYNMDIVEALECSKIVKAKVNIPVHNSKDQLYDYQKALQFNSDSRLILKMNEEIEI